MDALSWNIEQRSTGDYIINTTRDGNADGATTGTYNMTVRRANSENVNLNPLQPVEFRCGETLVDGPSPRYNSHKTHNRICAFVSIVWMASKPLIRISFWRCHRRH